MTSKNESYYFTNWEVECGLHHSLQQRDCLFVNRVCWCTIYLYLYTSFRLGLVDENPRVQHCSALVHFFPDHYCGIFLFVSAQQSSSSRSPGSFLSWFHACHGTFWGWKLRLRQQWNYRQNPLNAGVTTLLSFLFGDNFPVPSRQEQNAENLCLLQTLRTCWHHRLLWKSCNRVPKFGVLRIEGWKTRN